MMTNHGKDAATYHTDTYRCSTWRAANVPQIEAPINVAPTIMSGSALWRSNSSHSSPSLIPASSSDTPMSTPIFHTIIPVKAVIGHFNGVRHRRGMIHKDTENMAVEAQP